MGLVTSAIKMGSCMSRNSLEHPQKTVKWTETKNNDRDRKNSRPRGATIGGAHPLKQAAAQRRSRGMTEEDLASSIHEEFEVEEDIRKSLSEDSLSQKINTKRVLL